MHELIDMFRRNLALVRLLAGGALIMVFCVMGLLCALQHRGQK